MSDFTGLMPAAVVPAVLEAAQPSKRKAEDETHEEPAVAGAADAVAIVVADAEPAVAGTPATVSEVFRLCSAELRPVA